MWQLQGSLMVGVVKSEKHTDDLFCFHPVLNLTFKLSIYDRSKFFDDCNRFIAHR